MDTGLGEDANRELSIDKTRKTSKRRLRRSLTPWFEVEAVRLCRIGDRSVAEVAKDLDLTRTALREWVQRADVDTGKGPVGALTGDEGYLRKLEEHGVRRSRSRKNNPWDNAVIESFFSALRFELLSRTRFADPDEAERGIGEWIERFYNPHRRHTTLGNVSPIDYRLAWPMRKQRS